MLKTPILLITFNRPNHTRQVLQRILAAQPKELYVFQDGAREGNENDRIKCQEVRDVINELTSSYVAKYPNFSLFTYHSQINLGCGAGPVAGITWFFKHVEQGIVMEDDCLPHPDFFGYCEELLERNKGNEQVWLINSTLYHDRWKCEASYGFSHYMVTGAWAAWRRTWQRFDLDLQGLNAKDVRRQVKRLTKNRTEANWWCFKTIEIQKDKSKKSYWDYQMQIHLFLNNAVTIHPSVNLISNIGFDAEGTHTHSNDGCGKRDVFPILPLRHPIQIDVNLSMDEDCFAKRRQQSLYKDLLNYVYQSLLCSEGIWHKLLMLYKRFKHVGNR